MRKRHPLALAGLAVTMSCAANAASFAAQQLSDPGRDWKNFAMEAEYNDSSWLVDDGYLYCGAVPRSAEITIKCDMEILDFSGAGPKKKQEAGIGIYDGLHSWLKSSRWRLSLILDGDKPRASLLEVYDGNQITEGNGIEKISQSGAGAWEKNKIYKAELTLKDGVISGSIRDGDQTIFSAAYRTVPGQPGVNAGNPALCAFGMRVKFSGLSIGTGRPVPAKNELPAWQSRPDAPKVADGSGYFQIRKIGGAWTFVDPNGHAFFDIGAEHPGYYTFFSRELGYAPYHVNVKKKYGDIFKWGDATAGRLRQWGFSSVGYGESYVLRHRFFAHTNLLGVGTLFARGYPLGSGEFPNVFSPRWEKFCDLTAREAADEINNDPWCLGIMLDNELLWYRMDHLMIEDIFGLDAMHEGKAELWRLMCEKYGNTKQINEKLETSFRDRDDFMRSKQTPKITGELQKLDEAFMAVVAEKYFAASINAIRKHIPNHLVLGCRFRRFEHPAILKAGGRHSDTLSFNSYPELDLKNELLPSFYHNFYRDSHLHSGRPLMITEWSFLAMDSGLPNQKWTGFRVATQEDRARCYRIYANKLADMPFIVGCHFFMWMDSEPPHSGNYGLVNINDEPYETLVRTAAEVNPQLLARHLKSEDSGKLEITKNGGGVVISNPDKIPSRGKLWRRFGNEWRAEPLRLAAGESLARDFGSDERIMILERSDESRVSALRNPPDSPFSVANRGMETIEGLPVVFESGSGQLAAGEATLAPGESVSFAPQSLAGGTAVKELNADCGKAQFLMSTEGKTLCRVKSGSLQLGSLAVSLKYQDSGNAATLRMSRVTGIICKNFDGFTRAIVSVAASDIQDGQPNLTADMEMLFFPGAGIVFMRPAAVSNPGGTVVNIAQLIVTCNSMIKGSGRDNQPALPQVRDYYIKNNFWTGQDSTGAIGLYSPSKQWDLKINRQWSHTSAYLSINEDAAPGKNWTPANGLPWLWCFAGPSRADGDHILQMIAQTADIKPRQTE